MSPDEAKTATEKFRVELGKKYADSPVAKDLLHVTPGDLQKLGVTPQEYKDRLLLVGPLSNSKLVLASSEDAQKYNGLIKQWGDILSKDLEQKAPDYKRKFDKFQATINQLDAVPDPSSMKAAPAATATPTPNTAPAIPPR